MGVCERSATRVGDPDLRKHLGKVVLLRALGGEVTTAAPLGGETIGALTAIDGKAALKATPVK